MEVVTGVEVVLEEYLDCQHEPVHWRDHRHPAVHTAINPTNYCIIPQMSRACEGRGRLYGTLYDPRYHELVGPVRDVLEAVHEVNLRPLADVV